MKKNLARKVTLSILAGAVLMSSSVVWAEDNPNIAGWNKDETNQRYVWNDALDGEVNGNGHNFTYEFYGAYDSSNTGVSGGKVAISSGTFKDSAFIYGGYSGGGDASLNTITISDGEFSGEVYGGYAYVAATGNAVNITGGAFNGDVYGGAAPDAATGNAVNITGGTFNDYIYGGAAYVAATGNAVNINITDGTFNGDYIYGGYAYGAATGNAVNINITDGTFNSDYIYGGYAYVAATENTVNITLGDFESEIYGGYSEEDTANKNTVNITDGIFYGPIVGGYSSVVAEGNEVNITNGTFNSDYQNIIGGYSSSGNADDNTVTISGGTFNDIVINGGFAQGTTGDATGNTVTISAGEFSGVVYGGYSVGGKASGNTVNIGGTANLKNVELYGGAKLVNSEAKYFFGGSEAPNILNIDDWKNNKVKSIAGFDVINFANVKWDTTKPVVEVGALVLSDIVIKDGNEIRVDTEIKVGTVNVASGTELANGDKMALLSATEMYGKISNDNDKVVINYGIAEKFNGYVEQVDGDKKIYLKLGDGSTSGDNTGGDNTGGDNTGGDNTGGDNTGGDNTGGDNTGGDNTGGDNTGGDNTGGDNTGGDNTGGDNTGGDNTGGDNTGGDNTGGESGGTTPQPSRNDQVLVLGESRAAAVAFTNQGSELIETGLNALARDNEKDTKVFAAVYGNHSEYETGSHINVNGWSGIVGIGKTNDNGLTVGAFFENGEGNYSTHNIFTNDYIRGDGEACYNGGGFLVRKDNANGVYAEASLRAGNLQNELRNAVRNGSELTGYDIDTFYYGAHVGIGKVIARGNDGDSIDVYGKFIYTHHDGETFDIGGTATKFDSVESERLRLGFRINEVQTNKLSMYYGAAWEYEFNGDAHDKIASFDLETPSLEGSTVIGEIGAHYKASEKWSIDLNGRAYVGQREGFSGSVQANYAF